MALPTDMTALTLTEGGFATKAGIGPYLDAFEPYLTVSQVPVPEPGPGQALIRLRKAAINPSDIHFVKGEYGLPRVQGTSAGFEGCGDVVATGAGCEALEGQRVAFIGSETGTGAWAEYVLAEGASCVPLPDGIRDEDAAGFFVNPLTAVGMISLVEEAGSPAVVLSAGASQLSKLMIGLAAERGVKTIALVRRPEQVDMLKALGADHPLVTGAEDFEAVFAAAAKAEKPRVFLDAVVDDISANVFFGMPNRTRWVIYGLLDPAPSVLDQMGQLVFTGKRIEGFWLSHWITSVEEKVRNNAFATVFRKFGTGEWKTDIRAEITLKSAPEKLAPMLRESNTGKLLFVP
ncbi:MAG: zinc-binding dehydrogenase [Pseudomonadota bacterium]